MERDSAIFNVEDTVGRRATDRGIYAAAYIDALLQATGRIVCGQISPVGEYNVVSLVGIGQAVVGVGVINRRAESQLAVGSQVGSSECLIVRAVRERESDREGTVIALR